MTRTVLAAAASTLVLASCQSVSWPWDKEYGVDAPAAETPAVAAPTEASTTTVVDAPALTGTETCGLLASRGWEAWINKMPGPDMKPTLHVTGKVDARSGGWTFSWAEGPLDRSATPALRLRLIPKAPGGAVPDAITTETVSYQGPALASGYSRVIVSCGPLTLAEITRITVAQ